MKSLMRENLNDTDRKGVVTKVLNKSFLILFRG